MNNIEMINMAHEGDKDARDRLVNENTGLIWSIVRRFAGRGQELEDLFQIGCIGMLKAIDKFDVTYDVQFSTYAVPMITGEIKRFFRDDGIIRVSRSLKENNYKICKIVEKLTSEYGREPTIEEIAEEMQMSREDIVITMEANVEVESLHKVVYQNDGNTLMLEDKVSEGVYDEKSAVDIYGDDEKEKLINHIVLEQMIERLPNKEKELIILRYFKDKTQMEVASLFGISQVQVSRMEKKILLKMKEYVK